jgi:hypothetical protein
LPPLAKPLRQINSYSYWDWFDSFAFPWAIASGLSMGFVTPFVYIGLAGKFSYGFCCLSDHVFFMVQRFQPRLNLVQLL